MPITWLDEQNLDELAGKRVLCRFDFNVPVDDEGNILDSQRIELALPTLRKLLRAKAKVVAISHMGRPKGKYRVNLSLEKVGLYLRDLLNQDLTFVHDCVGDGVNRILSDLQPGSLCLLENLRFHGGEEKNDPVFAKLLAKSMDYYVNDAFGAIHRAHASVDGVVKHFSVKPLGGLLLQKELQVFEKLSHKTNRPFVAMIGGAKVSSKLGVLTSLLKKVDTLVIGGAMAYTFLKAQGFNVGESLVEDDKILNAQALLRKAQELGVKVLLPVDHVVAESRDSLETIKTIKSDGFLPQDIAFDIGPESIENFSKAISCAQTVFWNGPFGVFEVEAFSKGTFSLLEALAKNKDAFSVVGGGDSIAALRKAGLVDKISFVSTGGGASLELLEGKALPGLAALGFYK